MTVSPVQTLSEVIDSNGGYDRKHKKVHSGVLWFWSNWQKVFAEFLSTMMLISMGCLTTIPVAGSESVLFAPLGFGMIVMFNIQIFGHISGAYMNPAVTLSSVIFGKTSIPLGIAHTVVQCLGAIVGYGLMEAVTAIDASSSGICVTTPSPDQNVIHSLAIETILTTALMLINCATWDPINKDKQETAPLKFGLSILGLSLIGGPYTGASMNPARTLGPAVWTAVWTQHWIYWVGPILGSIIGTFIYMFAFLRLPKD